MEFLHVKLNRYEMVVFVNGAPAEFSYGRLYPAAQVVPALREVARQMVPLETAETRWQWNDAKEALVLGVVHGRIGDPSIGPGSLPATRTLDAKRSY